MRERRYILIVFCIGVLVLSCAAQEHRAEHSWDYSEAHGPTHWGDLTPEFAACKNGHSQSPIDIANPRKADLPPIRFDYKPSSLHIIDNGHTVMVNYAEGSSISVGDKTYALKQFHFHRPSEEKINGRAYEMAVHLVHQDQDGNLAVVAVMLQRGDDNTLVRELWHDLPKQKDKEEILNGVQINLADLLPTDRGYYTYPGGLTTPPCSENVTWFVLKHAVTVSPAEVEQFSKLYRHNVRPTQSLYDRVVLE